MRIYVLTNLDNGDQIKFNQMIDVEHFLSKSRPYVRNCIKNGTNAYDRKRNRYDIFVITNNRSPYKPGYQPQICWNCGNYAGGCEWADKFEPVPGWDATPTIVDSGAERYAKSYCIRECPKFTEG